ncbi:hypothetical protein Tco_0188912 [Tanacetum coccineum]
MSSETKLTKDEDDKFVDNTKYQGMIAPPSTPSDSPPTTPLAPPKFSPTELLTTPKTTPPISPHHLFESLDDLPPRTTNLPPPQPTFESIEHIANQPPLILDIMDMEPPLPPLPPHPLPFSQTLFYQNDYLPPWGNLRKWIEGEEVPDWVIRSQFEDKLANFIPEKDLHAKGLGEMLNERRNETRNQFSKILATLGKWTTTRDPPYPSQPISTLVVSTVTTIKREEPIEEETLTTRNHEDPQSPTLYHPYKLSSVPFLSRLKKQKNNEDE